MSTDYRPKRLPVSGELFGVFRASGMELLFAVEGTDFNEASSRVALIAPCLGFSDLSEGIVVQLDADADVTSVPTFYDAYFRGLDVSGDSRVQASATMH
jgi:hypothetical protein